MSSKKIESVPEVKKKLVNELCEKMKGSKTTLIVSIKGLPSRNFQEIKKILRGKGEVKVAKKSAIVRAIGCTEKGVLQNLKEQVGADVALIFSDIDGFELSGLLADNQSPARAKAGDTALEDIRVEAGPTDLIPGPAISELGAVGLKVAVENGKLAVKDSKTLVKKGEEIDEKVASVLGKLGIEPMRVGLDPIVAYDSVKDKVYVGIKIDRAKTLENLREAIGKGFGFAVSLGIINSETIKYFIAKAGMEEKALSERVGEADDKKEENKKEESSVEKGEEVKSEGIEGNSENIKEGEK